MTHVATVEAPLLRTAARRQPSRNVLSWLIAPAREHARALAALSVLYFGTAIAAAVYSAMNPALQAEVWRAAGQAFSPTGSLGPLVQSYLNGNLAGAILLTFAVNLVLGSLLVLTVPSAILPFAGILVGLYRAVLWGLLFAPTDVTGLGQGLWLHMPTILLEGEAYVVAMLGVWLWWRPVFGRSPSRWSAWRQGALQQVRIYALVAAILAVAATYEAIEVIWILPGFTS
jgi:hypothetical protein